MSSYSKFIVALNAVILHCFLEENENINFKAYHIKHYIYNFVFNFTVNASRLGKGMSELAMST